MYQKKEIVYLDRDRHDNYTRTLTMRVSETQLNALKDIAEKRNIKYQTMIKEIIDDFIKEHKKEGI